VWPRRNHGRRLRLSHPLGELTVKHGRDGVIGDVVAARVRFMSRVRFVSSPWAASFFLIALTAPAFAGGRYDWTGFYAGANAGWAGGKSDAATTTGCPTTAPPGWVCATTIPGSLANLPVLDAAGSGTLHSDGFTGGIEAGANAQSGNVVYGIELDYGALNLGSSRTAQASLPFGRFRGPVTIGSSFDTDWLFTARGRLGWAFQNVLIYATGGLAVTRLKIGNSYSDVTSGFEGDSRSEVKTGWTVGGGGEYAIDKHWSLKAEYLYVDFSDVNLTGNIHSTGTAGIANPLSISEDLKANIVRAGVNYRFN
jgi:outer membrane immunogenic protein